MAGRKSFPLVWVYFVLASGFLIPVSAPTAKADEVATLTPAANSAVAKAAPRKSLREQVSSLKGQLALQQEMLAAQQRQIEELRVALEGQKRLLERTLATLKSPGPELTDLGQVASLAPAMPRTSRAGEYAVGGAPAPPPPTPEPQESMRSYVERIDQLGKTLNNTVANLAGFRFSGDFRLRADGAFRSSNSLAGPVQDARGNYRLRFNIDKVLSEQTSFHFQVGSGRANAPLTYNTDFGGFANRGPIFIGEAWGSYHPSSNMDLLAGRIPELFADDSRFLLKEDIRFDGFQENFKIPLGSNPLGITRVEVRAGQYVLTSPNVPVLPSVKSCAVASPPANCAYLSAGYQPGQKVRDADLFHQGFAIYADIKPGWHHQFGGDLQWYRNQNQIALAATAAGAPVVIGPLYGTSSILPISGTGTATTTPGGAMFTASHFQVAHFKYRLGYDGWKVKDHEMPAYLEFHGARNVGTTFLNNAAMGIISFGETRKAGDVRLLYGYAIKEGNSMISEVTDDYLGSQTGVNMRTHEIRVDVGLSRFLTWQSYLYIQKEISGNDPARHFYVPLPAGAARQYRVQSQLQFKF